MKLFIYFLMILRINFVKIQYTTIVNNEARLNDIFMSILFSLFSDS